MSRIPLSAPVETQQAFRALWAAMPGLVNARTVDVQGRRYMNASDGEADTDLVTVQQVRTLLAAVTGTDETGATRAAVRVGAFAQRGAAGAYLGTFFAASDRNYVLWASTGAAWVYVAGVQYGTLSPDQKPTLTTNDANYRFRSTDFNREYRWNGSSWNDAPGQEPRFKASLFARNGGPENAAGWALCDGSTVTRSTTSGGTTSVTVPDLVTSNLFMRPASTTGTVAGNPTHHHAVDPPNTTSSGPSGTSEVQSGTGATVASAGHTHDTNIGSFNSGDTTTVPPSYDFVPYMRL
jgi:hypothetical protein